ncbi:hypothetical protein [Microcoleus sp. FACHB-672]|nr:hypothetical protein [Microcoleus sp. FACHB-672]MBD2040185.1 hypothetical protein [Microcoleus sp. FACHB-672]
MPSDSLGMTLALGFLMALMNAYILSLAPQSSATQEFQLQIELNVRGGVK